jgi:hypothetical protein
MDILIPDVSIVEKITRTVIVYAFRRFQRLVESAPTILVRPV